MRGFPSTSTRALGAGRVLIVRVLDLVEHLLQVRSLLVRVFLSVGHLIPHERSVLAELLLLARSCLILLQDERGAEDEEGISGTWDVSGVMALSRLGFYAAF